MPVMDMATCPNLAIPAQVMQRVVQVESDANPYAIGVVGGRLARQPQNAGEAIATVRELETQGYNFSVGLGQVNRANLRKYGLATYETAFDPCANLQAASRILADCYRDAGGDWGKAFSCYYAGDFVTGYRDGYVQRVFAALGQSMPTDIGTAAPQAIAVIPADATATATPAQTRQPPRLVVTVRPDSAAYRVALRSTLIDTATNLAISRALPLGSASPPSDATAAPAGPASSATAAASGAPADDHKTTAAAPSTARTSDAIFVPRVRGPKDPVAATANTPGNPVASSAGNALVKPADDAAFVF